MIFPEYYLFFNNIYNFNGKVVRTEKCINSTNQSAHSIIFSVEVEIVKVRAVLIMALNFESSSEVIGAILNFFLIWNKKNLIKEKVM